jgi:hypothetical protein
MALKAARIARHDNIILETLAEMAKERKWDFKSKPDGFHGGNEWDDAYCALESERFFCRFAVQQMPGCCAALILHHVAPEPYSRKVFDEVLVAIEEATKEAGFGSLQMAQVIGKRGIEDEIWSNCIENGKWLMSKPFVNAKSGNDVVYLTKDMKQPGKVAGLEILL